METGLIGNLEFVSFVQLRKKIERDTCVEGLFSKDIDRRKAF